MAKQTFTTGQVLTAAQMTSLQQTAMGGGSTTAKTTSYVLVAADAGTVVQMNAAGATTITVNTALFAAGDSVQIQNVGAGVCTITAGTATVSTSAVLTLKQYDSGTLYFNSTSAAIFFSSDAADSPLTTKGDIFTYSTTNARLGVGTDAQILVADSTASTGLKWATAASSEGMTLLNAGGTALSGDTTVGSIPGTYKHLFITVRNLVANNSGNNCVFRLNGDSGANYRWNDIRNIGTTVVGLSTYADTKIITGSRVNSTAGFDTSMDQEIWVYNYTSTDNIAVTWFSASNDGNTAGANYGVFQTGGAKYDCSAAITSITIGATDTLNGGRVYVYGVN